MELITAGGLAGKTTLLKSCYQTSSVNDVLSLFLRTLASENVSDHTIAKFDRLAAQSAITDDFVYDSHHIKSELQVVKGKWDPQTNHWGPLASLNKFNIASMISQLQINISDPAAAAVAAIATHNGASTVPQLPVEYLAFVAGRVFDLSNSEEIISFNAAFVPSVLNQLSAYNGPSSDVYDVYTLWYSSQVDGRVKPNTPIMQLLVDQQGNCYSFVKITAFNQGIQLRPGSYIQHVPESCSFNLMKELVSTATTTKMFALYHIKGAVIDNINVLLNELVQHGNAYAGGKYSSACNAFILYLKQRNVNFLASHNELVNYNKLSNMSATDYIRSQLFNETNNKIKFDEITSDFKIDYGSVISKAQDIYNDPNGLIKVITESGIEMFDDRIAGSNPINGTTGNATQDAVLRIGAYPCYFAMWKSDRLLRGTETENADRGFYYLDTFAIPLMHNSSQYGLLTLVDISPTYKYNVYYMRIYSPSSLGKDVITLQITHKVDPNVAYGVSKKASYMHVLNDVIQQLESCDWIQSDYRKVVEEMLGFYMFITKKDNGICRYDIDTLQPSNSYKNGGTSNMVSNYPLFKD